MTLICCSDLEQCSRAVISSIAPLHLNMQENHIIIVPDRYSLVVENMVFDELNISSTLNINVRGISSFARQILTEQGVTNECFSKSQSLLVIRKAISECSKNFKCFKKQITMSFVEEIYESISQLKSSEVTPEILQKNIESVDGGLKEKMSDILLVYSRYEELIADKLDSSKLLLMLDSIIEKSQLVKKSRIYFAGFDALTKQGYSLLCSLSKFAKSVTVGALKKNQSANNFLCDEELYDRVNKLAREKNIDLNVVEIQPKRTLLSNHIANNCFLSKPSTIKQDNKFSLTEAPSISLEVASVVKQIKSLIFKGAKFSEINIAVNLQAYEKEIVRQFDMCEFSYYTDSEISLAQTSIAKAFVSLLYFLENKYYSHYFTESFSQNLFDIPSELFFDMDNIIYKYGLYGDELLNIERYKEVGTENLAIIENVLSRIKTYDMQLKNSQIISDYVNVIRIVLDENNISEKLQKVAEQFNYYGQQKNEKLYLQVYDKFVEVLDSFSIIENEPSTLSEFIDLFAFAIEHKNVSSVPISADAIFVGDTTKSFFESRDNLFVLGANQNSLPAYISDCGIISDADIEKLKNLDIGPSVAMINRRNRFKLYDTLIKAKEYLSISYVSVNEEGKNAFVANFAEQLLSSFAGNNSKTLAKKYSIYDRLFLADNTPKENFEKLKKNCINLKLTKLELLKMQKFSHSHQQKQLIFSAVKKIDNSFKLEQLQSKNEKNAIKNAKILFFNKNRTKISQIEKYFDCPYKHFIEYGLRLSQRDCSQLDARIFGIILHSIAKEFIERNGESLGTLNTQFIKTQVEQLFNFELEKKEYSRFVNVAENKIIFEYLKIEAIEFCDALNSQQKNCDYKPLYLEKTFYDDFEVGDTKLKFQGVVDRIDTYEDYFRIIDYKSGKIDKILSSLYYGSKIQLLIYQRLVRKQLEKIPTGIFYISAKRAFEKARQKPFQMKGLVLNDFSAVRHMDTALSPENRASERLGVSLSAKELKNGELIFNSSNTVTASQLEKMEQYAFDISKQAVREMIDGNINLSPVSDACKYCQYRGACGFSETLNNKSRKQPAVNSKDFFKDGENE